MWQYHHKIFRHVENINNRITWINILLLLVLSLIPYLTLFLSENFSSFIPQALYGLDFILVDIILFVLSYMLLKLNPDSSYLKKELNIKNTLIIPFLLFILGFIVAFLGYPEAISIICLLTIIFAVITDIG